MGVRLRLTMGVDAGAFVLDKFGYFTQAPVVPYRQYANASALIVGDDDVAARGIHSQMAGAWASGGLLVHVGKLSGVGRDRVRIHCAVGPTAMLVDLGHCVKMGVVGTQCQERRILDASGNGHPFQHAS